MAFSTGGAGLSLVNPGGARRGLPSAPKLPGPGRINLPIPKGGFPPGVFTETPAPNPPGAYRGVPPPLTLPSTVHSNGFTLGVSRNPQGQIHFTTEGTPAGSAGVSAGAGGGGAAGGAGGSAPQQPSPLDATYYANVAANLAKVNSQVDALGLQQNQDQTALQSTLAQLAYQQPRAELALEQRANAAGNLFSSNYGQNLGNLDYGYLGKQGAAQSNFAGQSDTIAGKIAALQQGVPLYDDQQYAAAAARAAAAAAADKALGEQTGPIPGGGAAGAGAGAGGAPPPAPGTTETSSPNPPGSARPFEAPGAGVLPGTSRVVTTPTGMRLRVTSSPQGQVHFTQLAKTIAGSKGGKGGKPTGGVGLSGGKRY